MKYEAAIFDMDGTVLNTLSDLLGAMNHSLNIHGFPTHTLGEMRTYVGDGLYMMAFRAVPEGTDDMTIQSVYREFKAYYAEHLNELTKPYDGIKALLKTLKQNGIKTAISTNKFDAGAKLLTKTHFPGLIDLTLGETEGMPKKPDPSGVKLILEKLNADPRKTVYIGDSEVDVKTAENAGLSMIAVSWGFRTNEQLALSGAKTIATSVGELEKLILN